MQRCEALSSHADSSHLFPITLGFIFLSRDKIDIRYDEMSNCEPLGQTAAPS